VTQGLLNKVEMAFRAYDPCFACATHALPGEMPLEIQIYDHKGQLQTQLQQHAENTHPHPCHEGRLS